MHVGAKVTRAMLAPSQAKREQLNQSLQIRQTVSMTSFLTGVTPVLRQALTQASQAVTIRRPVPGILSVAPRPTFFRVLRKHTPNPGLGELRRSVVARKRQAIIPPGRIKKTWAPIR